MQVLLSISFEASLDEWLVLFFESFVLYELSVFCILKLSVTSSCIYSLSAYSFDGLLIISLLIICSCAYFKRVPRVHSWVLSERKGFFGVFYKVILPKGVKPKGKVKKLKIQGPKKGHNRVIPPKKNAAVIQAAISAEVTKTINHKNEGMIKERANKDVGRIRGCDFLMQFYKALSYRGRMGNELNGCSGENDHVKLERYKELM
uniref:Protein kish-B n=1 Tax=Syphacia muris TaxID=451379 RepID=A0A0N5AS45_9BILA